MHKICTMALQDCPICFVSSYSANMVSFFVVLQQQHSCNVVYRTSGEFLEERISKPSLQGLWSWRGLNHMQLALKSNRKETVEWFTCCEQEWTLWQLKCLLVNPCELCGTLNPSMGPRVWRWACCMIFLYLHYGLFALLLLEKAICVCLFWEIKEYLLLLPGDLI